MSVGPQFSVEGVITALNAQPQGSPGGGRAVLIVSARQGEGVTTVARAVAEAAGPGPVYAIDLNLKRNALAKAFSATASLGPKLDGRFDGESFYTLRDGHGAVLHERNPAFSYHRVGRTRVHAGVFDARVLPAAARVVVSSAGEYWDAACASGAYVVIDAPALDRSKVALRVARHMDGVVLVVGGEPGAAPAAVAAKKALVDAGANVIGLVYAGATAPVMTIDRLLRQAG